MESKQGIKLGVLFFIITAPLLAAGTDVTFETTVHIRNMPNQVEGEPVCIDSVTGQLTSGCTDNDIAQICKLYSWTASEYPEKCPPRIVFVTNQTFTGALGGVSGADNKCQQAANTAGLPGTFKAWISNDTEGSPSINFTRHGMFVNTQGDVIAYGWSQLTAGELERPIDVDENGDAFTDIGLVWTNTLDSGHPISTHGSLDNCGLFFFDHPQLGGWIGYTSLSSLRGWSSVNKVGCQVENHLFCFQQ